MSVAYKNRIVQGNSPRVTGSWQFTPGLGHCACCGDAGVQVESRTRHQHVQPQAQHADRLSLHDRVEGRIADVRPIDDGHATAPSTSTVSSGPMNAAVSSSSPIPTANGL